MKYRLPRLSAPAAGLVGGALAGAIDTALLLAFPHMRGTWLLPDWTWLTVPWLWLTVGTLVGVVFSPGVLRRLAGVALVLVGPGILLLSRAATPLKTATGMSTKQVLAVCLGVMVVLAIPAFFYRFEKARRLWIWLSASMVSSALVLGSALSIGPADLVARDRTPSSPGGHRNVVLVFLDTVRFDDAMAVMPRLARFRQSALSFDNAWAPAPWTVPSHFAVLTGLDPHRVMPNTGEHTYRGRPTTLAQRFAARGYTTGAVFANPLLSSEGGFARGYEDFVVARGAGVCRSAIGDLLSRLWVNDAPRSPICGWFVASEVTSGATRFIRGAERPYFLTLNYLDGHDPYYVRPECREAGDQPFRRAERERLLASRPNKPGDPEIAARGREQYRKALRCLDRSLGDLLDVLERDPDFATTSVVFVGDHGEHFERSLGGHGNSLYRELIHVPFMARIPNTAPATVDGVIAIADLYPAHVHQLNTPSAPFRLLDSRHRRPAIAQYRNDDFHEGAFSFTGERFHYIRWDTGREALFEAGAEIPLASQPVFVSQARVIVSRAKAAQTAVNEFTALGYLQ